MPNTTTTMDEFAEDLSSEADDLLASLKREEEERLARIEKQNALVEVHDAILPCTEGYFPDMFIPELCNEGTRSWKEFWDRKEYGPNWIRLAMLPAAREVRKLQVLVTGLDLDKLLSPSTNGMEIDPRVALVGRIFLRLVHSNQDESQLRQIEKKLTELLDRDRSSLSVYHAYFEKLVFRMKDIIAGRWPSTLVDSRMPQIRSDGRKVKTVTKGQQAITESSTTGLEAGAAVNVEVQAKRNINDDGLDGPVLSQTAQVFRDIFLAQQPQDALTGPAACEKYRLKTNLGIEDSDFRKSIVPLLRQWGLENIRKVGYFFPKGAKARIPRK